MPPEKCRPTRREIWLRAVFQFYAEVPLVSEVGRLLVVDDSDFNRHILSQQLRSRGFDVACAEDGGTALEMVGRNPPNLVLLDIMMPGLDGFQVLQVLRKKYASTAMAVIMVTVKERSDDIVRALEMGANDYILKPIDFPVVLARIRNQLARLRTEAALRESEERYALAAKGANDGLWDWDLRSHKVYYSERWKTMLGNGVAEIGHHIDDWFNRVHPDDLDRLQQELQRHFEGTTDKFECEYRMRMKSGGYRWMLSRGSAVRDEKRAFYRMVGWQTDSSKRIEHDPLTSLPNRGLFLYRLSNAIIQMGRSRNYSFCIFYMGIDRFKVINDSMGHEFADALLIALARRVEQSLRLGDIMARLGGDEFAILAENVKNKASASQISGRIREALAQPLKVKGQDIHVSMSLGITLSEPECRSADEILRRAHSALNLAKSRGRNRCEYYSSELSSKIANVLQMENQLRHALANREMDLVYQPQIHTATGMIVGVEALIRWSQREGGVVPPDEFIALAEESGLIIPMGEWVLQTACSQGKAWQEMGLKPVKIGVNLSSRQFDEGNVPEMVARALTQSGLEPHCLGLELTESLLMQNVERNIKSLRRLSELGVGISVDDFGTGYSSLSYLKRFPIDALKIDRTFVHEITSDPDDAAICQAIVGMAHDLRLLVVAEGVETREQFQFLKNLKCDEMQGFYFSRPVSPDQISELLKKNQAYL